MLLFLCTRQTDFKRPQATSCARVQLQSWSHTLEKLNLYSAGSTFLHNKMYLLLKYEIFFSVWLTISYLAAFLEIPQVQRQEVFPWVRSLHISFRRKITFFFKIRKCSVQYLIKWNGQMYNMCCSVNNAALVTGDLSSYLGQHISLDFFNTSPSLHIFQLFPVPFQGDWPFVHFRYSH